MKWYYYVIFILLIIVVLQECANTKQEPDKVQIKDLQSKISESEAQQGVFIEKQVYISGKTKTLVRIKEIHDTVQIIKVCLEKEILLDSLVIVSDSLVNSISGMKQLKEKQDSIFQCHINYQAAIIDSLEKSPKKYFKGLKHGFVLGVIVGVVIPRK